MLPWDFLLYFRNVSNPQIRVRLYRSITLPKKSSEMIAEVNWTGYVPGTLTITNLSSSVFMREVNIEGRSLFQRASNDLLDQISGFSLELIRPSVRPEMFCLRRLPESKVVSGENIIVSIAAKFKLYPGPDNEPPQGANVSG